MSIREKLHGLLSRKPRSDQVAASENPRDISVQFYDLREARAAQEKEVKPGYYLTVYPIYPSDLQDSQLLSKLSLSLLEKLEEEGLLGASDTRIPVDNKGKMFVDPAQGWFFSLEGLYPKQQLLVIRADHLDRDNAQRVIVTALR